MPEYNRRFTVKSKKTDNLHRKLPKGMQLNGILCIKTERVLKNDFTISYDGKLYQVMDKTNAKKVIVEKRINGTMAITHNGNRLRFKEIIERPEKENNKSFILIPRKTKKYIPAPDHPWRNYKQAITK